MALEQTGQLTESDIRAEAAETMRKMINAHAKAPLKKQWIQAFGVEIPGKYQVVQSFQAHLKLLNDICLQRGWAPVWQDPEEQPVKLGSLT